MNTRTLIACLLGALISGEGAAAQPLPQPTITSVTVTSYTTGDNHSIALPQTKIPQIEIHGTNFFTFTTATLDPLVRLKRTGYADQTFFGHNSPNSRGGDNSDGWIILRDVNLATFTPGSYDISIQQFPPNTGTTVMTNAFQLLPQQSPEHLVRHGGFGGSVNKVLPLGNLMYMNSGPRFVVLDNTNAMSPTVLGSIDLLTPILDFQIQGQYAFVSAQSSNTGGGGANGFCVLNVSNPSLPTLAWSGGAIRGITSAASVPNSCLDPGRIWLKGSHAYLTAMGANGGLTPPLYIFNISNPVSPQYVRSVTVPNSVGFADINGSYLYCWTLDNAELGNPAFLRIFDLGAGTGDPVQVGQVQCTLGNATTGDTPVCMASAPGMLALMTNGPDNGPDPTTALGIPTLALFNVANPGAPTLISRTPLVRNFTSMAIGSGRLYGTDEEGASGGANGMFSESPDLSQGLVIYDIGTDPANPTQLGSFKTHGSVYGVSVSGSRAYLRDHGEGLITVDCTNPASPARLGGYYSPSCIKDVARNGNLLYVSDQWNGFTILDATNLDHPTVVGVYQVDSVTRPDLQGDSGIAYRNGKVYLAVGDEGFNPAAGIDVVDVSDPTNPSLVQAVAGIGPLHCFYGLEMDGQVLHAGAFGLNEQTQGTSPLLVNYAIDPASGTIGNRAVLTVNSRMVNIQTVNGFTYCEGGIIDNHDPMNPFVVFSDSSPYGCLWADNFLFIRGQRLSSGNFESNGLSIRNVSVPTNPGPATRILTTPTGGDLCRAWAMAHNQHGRLFMSASPFNLTDDSGLFLMDTTPTTSGVGGQDPRILASLRPFMQNPTSASPQIQSGLLKVFGSLAFAADRTSGAASHGGPHTSQGLTIIEHVVPPACPADFNGANGLNVQDIFDFLAAWFSGSPSADFNHAGGISVQDIFDFLAAWFAGC